MSLMFFMLRRAVLRNTSVSLNTNYDTHVWFAWQCFLRIAMGYIKTIILACLLLLYGHWFSIASIFKIRRSFIKFYRGQKSLFTVKLLLCLNSENSVGIMCVSLSAKTLWWSRIIRYYWYSTQKYRNRFFRNEWPCSKLQGISEFKTIVIKSLVTHNIKNINLK